MPAEQLAMYMAGGIGGFIVLLMILAMVYARNRRNRLFEALRACGMEDQTICRDFCVGKFRNSVYSVSMRRESVGSGIIISTLMDARAAIESLPLFRSPVLRIAPNSAGSSLANFLSGMERVQTDSLSLDQEYLVVAKDPVRAREVVSKPEVAAALSSLFQQGYRLVELNAVELFVFNERRSERELSPESLGAAIEALSVLRPHFETFFSSGRL